MTNKKCGRPPKDDSKVYQYRVRLSPEDVYVLEQVCNRDGKTRAEVFRRGLFMQYNMTKF